LAGEERFSVAAYAVVENDGGEVLLTRRRESDDWVLPGGSVEHEEAPWEAVVREVAEETGLEVEVVRLVGLYAKRQERDLVLVFEASATGGEPRASDERDRVAFFDPGRLPAETSDRDRERIAHAVGERESPVLAIQPSAGSEPPAGTR
jgi:8-oxo-dGTP diphosphatase